MSRRPTALRGPLSVLRPPEVADFLDLATSREFAADDVLVRQGEGADHLLVLLRGRARVVVATGSGREVLVAVRGPGDVVGELAVLDPAARSATVSALEDLTALVVPSDAFLGFLHDRPHVMLALLRALVRRLRESDRHLVEGRTEDVRTRLARQLLQLGARYGAPSEEGIDLDVPLTQEQLASWIGTSREAVAMALRDLREEGAVATSRMRITLVDVDALRAVASGG